MSILKSLFLSKEQKQIIKNQIEEEKRELERKAKEDREIGELQSCDLLLKEYSDLRVRSIALESTYGKYSTYKLDIDRSIFRGFTYFEKIQDFKSKIELSPTIYFLSQNHANGDVDMVKVTFEISFYLDRSITDIPVNYMKDNNGKLEVKVSGDRYLFTIKHIWFTNSEKLANEFFRVSVSSSEWSKILNSFFKKVENHKKEAEKRVKFKENADNILACFYDVTDLCESYSAEYNESENCYRFLFNISSIKVKSYSIEYRKPYGKCYGGTGYVGVNKSNFYLDDKMLDFFYYLSEAKPRVNDLVPNCQFEVEMKNGQILLTIK
jgi:hypothetical protein